MAKSYRRYKTSKKNNRKTGKSRKPSSSRRRIGGLLAKPGQSTYKASLEAAKRGDQGVPIANPFGSKTLIATELPTMAAR